MDATQRRFDELTFDQKVEVSSLLASVKGVRDHFFRVGKIPGIGLEDLSEHAEDMYVQLCDKLGVEYFPPFDSDAHMRWRAAGSPEHLRPPGSKGAI